MRQRWSLYDTKDHCWIGTLDGPLLYFDHDEARLAAAVADERMGWFNRTKAMPYDSAANRKKDELQPLRTAEEAIIRLEAGV